MSSDIEWRIERAIELADAVVPGAMVCFSHSDGSENGGGLMSCIRPSDDDEVGPSVVSCGHTISEVLDELLTNLAAALLDQRNAIDSALQPFEETELLEKARQRQ